MTVLCDGAAASVDGAHSNQHHCWERSDYRAAGGSTGLFPVPHVSTYSDISDTLLTSCPTTLKHHLPRSRVSWWNRPSLRGRGTWRGESMAASPATALLPAVPSRVQHLPPKGIPGAGKKWQPRNFAAFRPAPLALALISSITPVLLPPAPSVSANSSQMERGLPSPWQSRSSSKSHHVSKG